MAWARIFGFYMDVKLQLVVVRATYLGKRVLVRTIKKEI
jgi:hypothetical protein